MFKLSSTTGRMEFYKIKCIDILS